MLGDRQITANFVKYRLIISLRNLELCMEYRCTCTLFIILIIIIIMIITLFQEDNIFSRVASLTYGPQLTNVGMIL